VADSREARQGTGSVDANGHDDGRLEDRHEPDEERPAGRELILPRSPVRQRSHPGRMGRADVPQDRLVLEVELAKDPMDDRRRVFHVAAGITARAPLRRQRSLGGEGDPGEPTARVPGCLPHEQEHRVGAGAKMIGEVLKADRRGASLVQRGVGVAIGIERRPDLGLCQIREQAIDRVHRVIIAR
jgi:hypothetical protein